MKRSELMAKSLRDLPPFPGVAWEVMRMVKSPDTGASDLERVVSRDPALAARVLKISNSALYGVRGTITTLTQAIVILGMKTLQSLVVAASSESLYKTGSLKDRLMWNHALGVALVSRKLARRVGHSEPEEAFVAGLLHDIGKTVLDHNYGHRYENVVQAVYNDGMTFLEAENHFLEFNHAEVGGYVLNRWNFAPVLQEAVRLHHQPEYAQIDAQLCAAVSLANALCVRLGVGPERNPDLDLSETEAASMLELGAEELREIEERALRGLKEEELI
ncbi:MAG TPA: HDOD domain-containing protein [Acidobacteriota bacterium]|nr:HDOD domain-containing protein [Acidobacteriota bacterium]